MSEGSLYSSSSGGNACDKKKKKNKRGGWRRERERERERERRERVCVVGGKGQAKHNEIPQKRASESTKTPFFFVSFLNEISLF
jgi:hypothetical protein